jgi:hypothetical protein
MKARKHINAGIMFRIIYIAYFLGGVITLHTLIAYDIHILLIVATLAFIVLAFVYAGAECIQVIRHRNLRDTAFFYVQAPIFAMSVGHMLFWLLDSSNTNFEPRIVLLVTISGLIAYIRLEVRQAFDDETNTPK